MLTVKLTKNNRQQVLALAVAFLRAGKTVAYPTDTLYGLGADALNEQAVRRVYQIKDRAFKQPIHVLVPDLAAAKKLLEWNRTAQKLAKAFLPGPLSIALPLKTRRPPLIRLSAGTGTLGFRLPKHGFAVELARRFKRPITATSANPSRIRGGFDPRSAADITKQFAGSKAAPDLIIDAGRLPRRRASTFVRISGDIVEILREGPVSNARIRKVL